MDPPSSTPPRRRSPRRSPRATTHRAGAGTRASSGLVDHQRLSAGKSGHLPFFEQESRVNAFSQELTSKNRPNRPLPKYAGRLHAIALLLQWDWFDLPNGGFDGPDSKTGDLSKPLSEEARRLLTNAPRY